MSNYPLTPIAELPSIIMVQTESVKIFTEPGQEDNRDALITFLRSHWDHIGLKYTYIEKNNYILISHPKNIINREILDSDDKNVLFQHIIDSQYFNLLFTTDTRICFPINYKIENSFLTYGADTHIPNVFRVELGEYLKRYAILKTLCSD